MSPKIHYPQNNAECIKLLRRLGFQKRIGIGRGKHPEKYTHPTRRNQNSNDRPFIIISHEYFDEKGKKMMKKLENWGFTKEELQEALVKS
ncbi:MAG: hypothetical protein LBM12_00205 [Candidatus Nomurabacteria bacterium]|nr:hypothetical protein [Candidatus Nomurabacteria bacterium]